LVVFDALPHDAEAARLQLAHHEEDVVIALIDGENAQVRPLGACPATPTTTAVLRRVGHGNRLNGLARRVAPRWLLLTQQR
jgi:hypothetical protein